jgi:peptidoglycan/LPS O-acetylase OafA/YrhL
VGWSLEIEVQFYCLVPIICLALRIQNKALRRSLFIATIALAALAQMLIAHPGRLHVTLLFYAQYFLGGILLADIFVTDWRENPTRSIAWDLVALLGWPSIFLVPPSLAALELPLLIFITYYATFRGRWSSRVFSSDALTIIGGMCYTIYLIHYPIISAVGRFSRFRFTGLSFLPYFALQTLLCSIAVMIFSATYFVLIERPCMYKDWPQRLWKKVAGPRRLPEPLSTPQRIET